jgi:hypothetical protein
MQLIKVGQQWIVFLEVLSETETGIKGDAATLDAVLHCNLNAVGEFVLDVRGDVVEPRQVPPFRRAATCVHQYDAAFQLGAG